MGIVLSKFIDRFLGAPACAILSLKRKKEISEDIKSIAIIQLWGIGETILTLPAIKRLKSSFPKSKIDIVCTSRNKDVYKGQAFIDGLNIMNIDPFSIKWFMLKNLRKYDLALDMEEYLNTYAIISFFIGKSSIGYSHGIRSWLYSTKVRYDDKQHCSQTFMDLLKPLGIDSRVA